MKSGRAQTPHERALSHLEISEMARTTLKATFATIHLAAPYDQIETLTSQLAHISFTRGLAPTGGSIRTSTGHFTRRY